MTGRSQAKLKLAGKLQYRWVGPYRIVKVISPVLYDANVHGKTVRTHAVNMKPKTEDWMKDLAPKSVRLTKAELAWIAQAPTQRDDDEDHAEDRGGDEEEEEDWGTLRALLK